VRRIISRLGSHKIEGNIYPNLPSICREYNISLNTVYKRWSRGKRGDELIPLKKRKSYIAPVIEPKFKLIIDGIKFKSYALACVKYNVKFITFRVRKKRGLTDRQALGLDPWDDGRRKSRKEQNIKIKVKKVNLVIDGIRFTTYKSIAEHYKLPCHVLYNRMHYGYTVEQAVKMKGKGYKTEFRGKKYKSYAELARAYNMTPEDFLGGINRGKTINQILGFEPYITKNSVKYMGKIYKSMTDLASDYNLSPNTLHQRLRIGLSLDQAIKMGETPVNPGRYNETILNRSPETARKPAMLYFIQFKIEGINRYKVGITEQRLKDRFKKIRYYHVIKTYKSSLINCYKLEQLILDEFKNKKDKSVNASHLDGYSEVLANLSSDNIDRIINLINRVNN